MLCSSSENWAPTAVSGRGSPRLFLTFPDIIIHIDGDFSARLNLMRENQSFLALFRLAPFPDYSLSDPWEHCSFLSFVKLISWHLCHLGPIEHSEHFRWTLPNISSFFYIFILKIPTSQRLLNQLLPSYPIPDIDLSWHLWNRHENNSM